MKELDKEITYQDIFYPLLSSLPLRWITFLALAEKKYEHLFLSMSESIMEQKEGRILT